MDGWTLGWDADEGRGGVGMGSRGEEGERGEGWEGRGGEEKKKEEGVFFFQAEDGIRDFCLSRGLGGVYKRQGGRADSVMPGGGPTAFSYTHLTLPTIHSV